MDDTKPGWLWRRIWTWLRKVALEDLELALLELGQWRGVSGNQMHWRRRGLK